MNSCVDKLLELATRALCQEWPRASVNATEHLNEAIQLCLRKNGFYAFESALHVYPMGAGCNSHMHAETWNATDGWKRAYGGTVDSLWCFAEDVFGEQFAISDGAIVSFNPETGEVASLADSLEDWACRILVDYEYLTGYPLARDWQAANRPLHPGERLVPKTPFALGGEYNTANLYAMNATKAMELRGDIYRQICGLSDGARVRVTVKR